MDTRGRVEVSLGGQGKSEAGVGGGSSITYADFMLPLWSDQLRSRTVHPGVFVGSGYRVSGFILGFRSLRGICFLAWSSG